nr:hypothetical protein BaRGS_006810 [Batillaria attramentaria]
MNGTGFLSPAEEFILVPGITTMAQYYHHHHNNNNPETNLTLPSASGDAGADDSTAVSASLASTRFVVQTIVTPIVVTIGLLGNLLNVLVLVQPSMRTSTNVYLLTLSVADVVYLVFSFALSFVGCRRRGLSYAAYAFNTYGRTISDMAGNVAVWIVVIFTVERYVAVCHPMHGKIWCTVTRAKLFSLGAFFFCFVNTSPGFFELEITVGEDGPKCTYTQFAQTPAYELGYTWWFVTIFSFIPFVFLLIFNSLLIHALIRANRERELMLLPWTILYLYRAYLSAHNMSAAGSDAMKIAGNVDYRQASPEPSSSKKTVRDKGKQLIARNRLHDIFSLITRDKSFTLDEDISIAIQRNPYAEPSEESTVRKVFDEELFTMIRSHSEGQRQIFDREELKAFGHDSNLADDPDFERRVIRLKPGKSSQEFESSSSSVQRFRSTHKITRMIERDSGRSRSKSPPRRREQEVRLKLVPDPRYEARYADMQKKDGSSSRKLDPADLRHELRGSATTSAATSSSKSLGDLRSRLDKRDERPWLSMKDDSRDVKADSRRDTDAPDYSRRKDKYQYAEWMDKPEMIPKNPSYFEHDNRDELRDSRDRGRGRGRSRGFRGRFMYRRPYRPFRGRGTFRGRGRGSSDRYSPPPHSSHSRSRYDDVKRLEGEWKHDKFAELEGDTKPHREDDQHPHSTSER